jgi:uncharacterized protein
MAIPKGTFKCIIPERITSQMLAPHTLTKPCPLCGKPAEHLFRPFCSKRCKDVDLGRWFTERYVVPGEESAADENDAEQDGKPPTQQDDGG